MDLTDRVWRRYHDGDDEGLVVDYEALSPTTHVEEPTARGPVLERLLDHLDPVFEGNSPPNAYVWGERGVGKSAVLTALCHHLDRIPRQSRPVIHTTTRAQSTGVPAFVYVDARGTPSEFAFYRALLDALVDEPVPDRGVDISTITDRLVEVLSDRSAVVVVDHAADGAGIGPALVADALEDLAGDVSWIAVGRSSPATIDWEPPVAVEIAPYDSRALVDVVMTRAADALGQRALAHEGARRIARWAEGDAHDALTLLFVAADTAARENDDRIDIEHVESAIEDIPQPLVSIGRIFALSENRQSVLRAFVSLGPADRNSVSAAAERIASAPDVDLSAGTVERFLYELADDGVLERRVTDRADGQGRPPSRLVPRFSPTLFRRLYDRE